MPLGEYADKLIKVGFVYEYSDGFQMAIDDVRITQGEAKSNAKSNHSALDTKKSSIIPLSNFDLGGFGIGSSKDDGQTVISLDHLKGYRVLGIMRLFRRSTTQNSNHSLIPKL